MTPGPQLCSPPPHPHQLQNTISQERTVCLVNNQSISRAITPQHSKRVSKLKQRYSPDQSTPKPPKRRKKKTKTKHQLPSKNPVISKCDQDPIGILIRQGGESRLLPRCQHCNEAIPLNRWRVINRVKRKGDGYDVKQIHIFMPC
jgi:hypothetical protein